jgi:carboxypeptidase family protein
MQRDVDAAGRAFADARNLTKDKDERGYLGAAINELNKAHNGWFKVLQMKNVAPTNAARMLWCLIALLCAMARMASAQHPAFRVKGRVVTERGQPIAGAAVDLEAFFGYAAGTFAGQRTFSTETNAKGEWNVGAMQPGIWLFTVTAPGYLPETVALPIRILTTVSMGTSGMALTWDLVLKAMPAPDNPNGEFLTDLTGLARQGKTDDVRLALRQIPPDPDADYLAAAGRVALLARDVHLAQTLFVRALERDPTSYRAALGIASAFVLLRDFDNASRAFDATRHRTRDKDEQKFLSAAIGDLATIKVR